MSLLFPFLGFALFVLSLFVQRSHTGKFRADLVAIGAFAVVTVASIALTYRFATVAQQAPMVVGILIGTTTGLVASLADFWEPDGSALLALAAFAGGLVLSFSGKSLAWCSLTAPVGAAIAAMTVPNRSASILAIALTAVCACQVTGTYAGNAPAFTTAGEVVLLAAALIGIAQTSLASLLPKAKVALPFVSTVLGVMVAFLCATRYLPSSNGWLAFGIAPVAALLASALQGPDQTLNAFPNLLSSVIWIGIATVAFGLRGAYGITLAFLLSAAMLIVFRADRALVTSGPLMALTLHRVFRAMHPDVSQSIDIGQHYALVGLCLGALIPLMPEEWLDSVRKAQTWRRSAGAILWVLVAFTTPALLALFLSPKGLLGFVTGLGLSGFFGALKSTTKPVVLALAGGLGTLSVAEYGWLEDVNNLPREDKIHWFLVSAVVLAMIAALFLLLSREMGKSKPVRVSA